MARMERNKVSYFPHDAKASTGDTLTILQNRFGNNGYAVWFKILEKLADADGHFLDCNNPIKWQLLVAYFGIDDITTVEILKLLVEINAIDEELWQSKVIWCQNLVDNLAEVYRNRRREKPLKPFSTGDNSKTTGGNPLTTPQNTQSKVEESRVKESRVNKSKVEDNSDHPELVHLGVCNIDIPWWDLFYKELRQNFDYNEIIAEIKRFNDYWSDSRRKLKSPKLALRNWFNKAREIKAEKALGNAPERSHLLQDDAGVAYQSRRTVLMAKEKKTLGRDLTTEERLRIEAQARCEVQDAPTA